MRLHPRLRATQIASTLIAVFGFNGYEEPRDDVNPCQVSALSTCNTDACRHARRARGSGAWLPSFLLLACLPHAHRAPFLQYCTLSSGGNHPFWSNKAAPISGTESQFTASGARGRLARLLSSSRFS